MPRDYNNQGIYIIKNLINGNSYIGQSIDLDRRWWQHINYTKNVFNYPLYRAFRKYGIENFEFKDLEYVENFEDLTDREQYWYDKLNPIYNQLEPRECNVPKRKIYKLDLINKKILKEYKSIIDAEKDTGLSSSNIVNVCRGNNRQTGGYVWCYIEDYNDFEIKFVDTNKIKKPVYKILNGIILEKYASISDASKQNNVNFTDISKVCNKKKYRHTAGGYKWQYVNGGEQNRS